MIYWMYLILAGLFEVGVTFCLGKLKDVSGLELIGWSLALLGGMAVSIFFVNKSMDGIPLGIAYPVWTGIGAAGAVIVALSISACVVCASVLGSLVGSFFDTLRDLSVLR